MTIPPISFVDRESGDEALVLVRVIDDLAGLALSLRHGSDLEVVLGLEDLEKVIEALQTARLAVRASNTR